MLFSLYTYIPEIVSENRNVAIFRIIPMTSTLLLRVGAKTGSRSTLIGYSVVVPKARSKGKLRSFFLGTIASIPGTCYARDHAGNSWSAYGVCTKSTGSSIIPLHQGNPFLSSFFRRRSTSTASSIRESVNIRNSCWRRFHSSSPSLRGTNSSSASTSSSSGVEAPKRLIKEEEDVPNANSFSDTVAINETKNTKTSPSCNEAGTATGFSTLGNQLKCLSTEDQELIFRALQDPSSQKASRMGGEGIGPVKAEMVAAFTCGRCEYRMVKRFSKHAYTKGIVVVQCPNCEVKHLLADNLGWWHDGESKNIEDILREKGEKFIHLGGGDYQAYDDEETKCLPTAKVLNESKE